MSTIEVIALVSLVLALVPALLIAWNLRLYRAASGSWDQPPLGFDEVAQVSVLIPARNEADKIARTLEAVRANRGVDLEILVMDDASEDGTAEIVRRLAKNDPRIRLLDAPALPAGWCGKQHACWQLAKSARFPLHLFLDADVTLSTHALSAMAEEMRRARPDGRDVGLISGIPRQITESLLERLLIPLIHFVLLGFLPVGRMRRSTSPAYAAGCGQLMLADRAAYFAAGGHRAIRASRHDGIQLPRAFRRAGFRTDLFDGTDLAACRMYRTSSEVWNGLVKNATEGMASPRAIVPWTLLLLGGQVAPPVILLAGLLGLVSPLAAQIAGVAWVLGSVARFRLAFRFHQSLLGAWLHPVGVSLLVTIQWVALGRAIAGRPVAWKGRTQEDVLDATGSP
jgi:hypothetical protein